jgi:MFS family permease
VREGALAERQFRLLLAGGAVSSLGDRLVPVALAFAVLQLTGSVSDLGLVLAAQSLPLLAFVLFGGVWADRLPRQRVMLASDALRMITQGASAALLFAGAAQIWQLAALQALYGAAEGFFIPAATALVPQTVKQEDLQQANALLGLCGGVAAIAGPALAGVIVASIGPEWGLAIDAATFLISAAFLSMIRVDSLLQGGAQLASNMIAELRDGWQAFRSRRWLWVSVVYFTLYLALAYSPFRVLGPEVARTKLGGAGAWAAISTALGVGALAGGLLGLRWRPRYPLRSAFLLFLISGPSLYALLAAHVSLAAIIAVALLDGALGPLFNALWYTAMQREVPAGELSRVSSWDAFGALALEPAGLAASGPIAAAIGLSATLYGAGALALILTLAVLAVPAVRNFTPS